MLQADTDLSLISHLIRERILLLDGAMGTMIQRLKLDEVAVRGERFAARHVNPTVDRRRPHVIQLLVGGCSARRNGGAPRGVDDCRATAQRRAAEERSTARRCAKDERAEEGCHIVRLSEVIERSRARGVGSARVRSAGRSSTCETATAHNGTVARTAPESPDSAPEHYTVQALFPVSSLGGCVWL